MRTKWKKRIHGGYARNGDLLNIKTADAVIADLEAFIERLGNALREQNERWGLYGNESNQVLKDFEILNIPAAMPNVES
jgi:hypothetical protein